MSEASEKLKRRILSEREVRLISRKVRQIIDPILGDDFDRPGLSVEDSIRFQSVATRLREARHSRGMDLKAMAKELRVPQYRLRYIEECNIHRSNPAEINAYIDHVGLNRWFARWRKANPKLAARLFPDAKQPAGKTTRNLKRRGRRAGAGREEHETKKG